MIYRFGAYEVNVDTREFRSDGNLRAVEPQVFDLLKLLIENRDRVITRGEILKKVWNGRIVSDAVLDSRIYAARKSIDDDARKQRLIRTFRGVGYRFVGTVSEENHATDTLNIPTVCRGSVCDLAVIPIIDPFTGEELSDASKAIADELTVALVRSQSFGVIAHGRVSTNIGEGTEVGRELGSRYVLACGVRRLHDEVRFLARIINVSNGLHIWARAFDYVPLRPNSNQAAIVAEVAAAVEPTIFLAQAAKLHHKPSTAEECFLHALHVTRVRTQQNYALAESLLARAIELEPNCARAHGLRAYYHGLQVLWGWKARHEAMPVAIEAAEDAIAINEQDAWAHFALGWALTQNRSPEQGIEEYRKALTINPYFPSAYSCLGLALAYIGQSEHALAALEKGERLNAPEIFLGLASSARAGVYACAEKYGDAVKAARSSVRQAPGLVVSQRQLVVNSVLGGEMDQARVAFQAFLKLVPSASLDTIALALPYIRDTDLDRTLHAFRRVGLQG